VQLHSQWAAQCTFPNVQYTPGLSIQIDFRTPVTVKISFDLFTPEFMPSFWPFEELTVVAMPETAVNENHGAIAWKYQVRSSRELALVQTEAKASRVKPASNNQLKLCI